MVTKHLLVKLPLRCKGLTPPNALPLKSTSAHNFVFAPGPLSHVLCQVTYDDGSLELGVDPRRLRRPEEAVTRAAKTRNINDGSNYAAQATGPDWERGPVRPAIDVRVAVHGFCEIQLCQLVLEMLVGGKLCGEALLFAIIVHGRCRAVSVVYAELRANLLATHLSDEGAQTSKR